MEERWVFGEEREARFETERRKKMEMKQRRDSRGKRESLLGGGGVAMAYLGSFSAFLRSSSSHPWRRLRFYFIEDSETHLF